MKGGLLEDGEILHEAVVDDVLYDLIDKIDLSNEGEIPQYYVEDNHEAIIDPDPHNRGLPSQVHRLFSPRLIPPSPRAPGAGYTSCSMPRDNRQPEKLQCSEQAHK